MYKEVALKNTLALAFVGDSVMDLLTREKLVQNTNFNVAILHKQASSVVCARAQSKCFLEIEPQLTEDELDVARRARNAKHHTTPSNCSLTEYRNATALEAVIGYNWLSGNKERCAELIGG